MDYFHSDDPIKGDEQSPDHLHRTGFAGRLSKVLLSVPVETSLIVSLEGPWGFGKTSVVNLIKKSFDEREDVKPIILYFNPWMIGKAETLAQDFLVQLAASISTVDYPEKGKEAADQLIAYSTLFDVLKFVPGAEPWTSFVQNFLKSAGTAVKEVATLKEQDIHLRRSKVIESLKALDQPIIVFIDDLDRLPAAEIYQMIRLIKAISNFPRMAYLLVYDHAYLVQALEASGIANGTSYLEKIVQVRVPLPPIHTNDIDKIVNDELTKLGVEKLLSHFPNDTHRIQQIYQSALRHILGTPRDIKRIVNRLRFSTVATAGEVAFADLFVLETLAAKAPDVYQHIKQNPRAYVGRLRTDYFADSDQIIKSFQAERDDALKKISLTESTHISSLLEFLFPLVRESNHGSLHEDSSRMAGQIANPDILLIALNYGVPNFDVSMEEIQAFIKHPKKRPPIIKDMRARKLIDRFADRMLEYIDSGNDPIKNLRDFFGCMARLLKLPEITQIDNDLSFIKNKLSIRIPLIVHRALKRSMVDDNYSLLSDIFSDSGKLALSSMLLELNREEHGFYGKERETAENQRLLTSKHLNQLQDIWIKSCKQILDNRKIFKFNGKDQIFWTACRLNPEIVKVFVSQNLGTDKNFKHIIRLIGATGTDSTNGKFVEFDEKYSSSFVDTNVIKDRAKALLRDHNKLPNDIKAICLSIVEGKKYYLNDATEGR